MRGRTRKFDYKGKQVTVADIMKMTGMKRKTINERLRRGWCIEDVIEVKDGRGRRIGTSTSACGATSFYDCFSCEFDDCIVGGDMKFKDTPKVVSLIVRGKENG